MPMATQSFILPVMKMWNSGSVNAFRNASKSLEPKPSQRHKDTLEKKVLGHYCLIPVNLQKLFAGPYEIF